MYLVIWGRVEHILKLYKMNRIFIVLTVFLLCCSAAQAQTEFDLYGKSEIPFAKKGGKSQD